MKQTGSVVLVVEDHEEIAALITYFLRRASYRPVVAGNGTDGLRLARELAPALVLCDACLPGLNGPDLLAVLRADPATERMPFVLMSGYDTARGSCPTPDAFVSKPFRIKELIALIKSLTERSSADPSPADVDAGQSLQVA
jgi:two-component system alkaline phosphatase synthesis response regulator PhoP